MARIDTHNRWPTGYELAAAYLSHLGRHSNDLYATRLEMIMPIASDFLNHLEAALQAHPVPIPAAEALIPARLKLYTSHVQGQPHIMLLQVEGELDRYTYPALIEAAVDCHGRGQPGLLLDLRQTTQIELSGLFALLSIARLYSGQTLLDPESGLAGLRRAAETVTPALGERVKLLAPSPVAAAALQGAHFCQFFTHYPDLETALTAFPKV